MKRIAIAVLGLLALAGCRVYYPNHWTKQGADNYAFEDDMNACEKSARADDFGGNYLFGGPSFDFDFNSCMRQHGWELAD